MKTMKSMIALLTTLVFMCTVFASCGIPTPEAETPQGDTSGTSVTVTTTEQAVTTTKAPTTTVKPTTTTKQQTTATTQPQTTTTKKPTTVPTTMTAATPTTVPTTVMTDAPTTTTVKKTTTTTVKPTTTTTKKATTTVKPTTTTTVKKTTTTTVKPTTTTTKKTTTTTVKPTTTTTKKPTTTTTTTTTTTMPTTTTTTAPNTNTNSPCAEALRVFELINEERVKAGVAPLEYCYELQPGVDLRAQEISGHFSHTRPNGTSCFTVVDDLGLSVFVCGENIAQGHTTPEWVMSAWMNSQGHRENILRDWFTGVAVGYDPLTNSWVQMFTV